MGLHDHAEALIGLFASRVTNKDGWSLPAASTIQWKPSLQQRAGVPRSQYNPTEQPNQCIHLLLLCKPSSLFLLLPHFSYFSLPCHCSIKMRANFQFPEPRLPLLLPTVCFLSPTGAWTWHHKCRSEAWVGLLLQGSWIHPGLVPCYEVGGLDLKMHDRPSWENTAYWWVSKGVHTTLWWICAVIRHQFTKAWFSVRLWVQPARWRWSVCLTLCFSFISAH